MAVTVDIGQSGDLAALLDLARAGDEVLFAEGGKPVARLSVLVPAVPPSTPSASQPRVAGLHRGAVSMADDFDAALPESFWLGES